MSKATLPVRLARRELLRRPGRTLLVAVLIALPVAGMAGAVTLIRTDHTTPLQDWESMAAGADAIYSSSSSFPGGKADPPTGLPAGTRAVAVISSYPRVRTADLRHRSSIELTDMPLADPITSGRFDLLAGRPARAAGEILLAPRVARGLGVGVGDALELDHPAVRLAVVGLVEQPSCLSCPTGLMAPGQIPVVLQGDGYAMRYLLDLPDHLSSGALNELRRGRPAPLRFDLAAGLQ